MEKSELAYVIVFVSSLMSTTKIKYLECCVWLQCITQRRYTCFFNVARCWFDENEKEWFVDGWHLCVVYLSSPFRTSSVSVVFLFNASLNVITPISPMLLSVYLKNKKSILFMCTILSISQDEVKWVLCLSLMHHWVMLHLLLQCCSLCIQKRMDKSEAVINVNSVHCFYAHISNLASWVLCLISMRHSMMLLLFLQCCYLFNLIW